MTTAVMKKTNNVGSITILDFMLYHRARVTKISMILAQNKDVDHRVK